jgi:hypothetical protein
MCSEAFAQKPVRLFSQETGESKRPSRASNKIAVFETSQFCGRTKPPGDRPCCEGTVFVTGSLKQCVAVVSVYWQLVL